MTIREAKRIRVGDWVCVKNPDGSCQQSQKVIEKTEDNKAIYLRLADGTILFFKLIADIENGSNVNEGQEKRS